jgi:hypothetical protein
MLYARNMSHVNALWLATAVWVLGVVLVVSLFGLSSWGVALTLFAGVVPLLFAHRLSSAQDSTMSQDIQRELR